MELGRTLEYQQVEKSLMMQELLRHSAGVKNAVSDVRWESRRGPNGAVVNHYAFEFLIAVFHAIENFGIQCCVNARKRLTRN